MHRLLKITLLSPLLFCSAFALGQNPDIKRTYHWYFGDGVGLDFSSGTPVAVLNGDLHTYEGCASISDTAGNLLFYTDGDTVWNNNHLPMPNGTGLMGCGNYGSSTQAALIIAHPGNDSLFYIFTSDCWNNAGLAGYRYSIVNIYLNGGLGDVTIKNALLYSPCTEALTAAKHSNGLDIWLMTHEYNTNNFVAYKIDNTSGLITTPVISTIGDVNIDYVAALKFSPNGKKIASTAQLFDFDASTGIVTDVINLNPVAGYYYPAFSPDNSKLYYTLSSSNDIFQYCLTVNDSSAIINSLNWITPSDVTSAYGQMSIGADGKIYIAVLYEDSITVINNPNFYGTLCNITPKSFSLAGNQCELGLVNFPDTYFYNGDTIQYACDSTVSIFENNMKSDINIFPNPFNDFTNIYFPEFDKNCNIKIGIYNLLGVKVKELFADLDGHKFILNRNNLNAGIYILQIQIVNKIYSQKIIIIN